MSAAIASALEFISDRSVAIASDRIRELEAQLATVTAQLATERRSRDAEVVGLPALAQAVEDCAAHFARVIDDAKAELPPSAQAQISDLEKRLAAAQAEADAARRERDDARKTAEALGILRDACLRWDTDNYSPRLKNVIAAFRKQEVGRR